MLAPARMWTGACHSSSRRGGSSSWELGRSRDGSGTRFLIGVREGLLRVAASSVGFLTFGLIKYFRNDSSIPCASKACPSRSRGGACPSRSREGACQQERWQIAKVQEEAKSRVGSAALTFRSARRRSRAPGKYIEAFRKKSCEQTDPEVKIFMIRSPHSCS